MSLAKEFKEFIARGNVIDLAVGVIIGAAFGNIVNSLVKDVLTPLIGLVGGSVNFADRFINLGSKPYATYKEAVAASAPIIGYGNFINTVIQFLIVSACVFLLVKVVNKLKREHAAEPPPPAPPSKTEVLLEEIRDALKNR